MSEDPTKAELRRLVVEALERAASVAALCRTGPKAAKAIREMAAMVAVEDDA